MNIFLKYCPNYTRLCVWLWNSPTFTTWGNQLIGSSRLFLVTPLILTRFSETEIAAWYLFGSLNFFGVIVSQRMGMTFSRMFAFAMGGAEDLSPIKGKREQENEGQPNWAVFERAYGTVASVNLGLGLVNVLVAWGMGWYGLSNILAGDEAKGSIWLAFAILQGCSFVRFVFDRYAIALRGMNYIALSNRWSMIFSLLGVLLGSLSLYLGASLLVLVIVMQLLMPLGIIRDWFLLKSVEEGRVARFKAYRFDREVIAWAWAPTWKGFIGQFGMNGSIQLTAVIYTAHASTLEVASFLFSIRMMQTLTQMAQAPFSSVQPLMSRLMAAGEIEKLGQLVRTRMIMVLSLMAAIFLGGAIFFPFALQIIGSKLTFIPVEAWLLLGGLTLLLRFDVLCCAVSAIGNEMVYYWEMAIASLLSAIIMFFLRNKLGVYGPILISVLPMLLLFNVGPLRLSAKILQQKVLSGHGLAFVQVLLAYLVGCAFCIVM